MGSRGKKMVLLCTSTHQADEITEVVADETHELDNLIITENILNRAEWIVTDNDNTLLQPLEVLQGGTLYQYTENGNERIEDEAEYGNNLGLNIDIGDDLDPANSEELTISSLQPFEGLQPRDVNEDKKNGEENFQNEIDIEKNQREHESNEVEGENENNNEDPDWLDDEEICMDSGASSDYEIEDSVQEVGGVNQVVPSEGEENEIIGENEPVLKKRRKIKCPETWHDLKNKKLREQGKAYVGWRRDKGQKAKRGADREPRQMGQRCTSKMCAKSKIRDCDKMSEDERKLLFDNFWSKMSWDQRKIYICSLVTRAPTQRTNKAPNEVSRRKRSLIYSVININDKRLTVCKKLFLSTFGLKEWSVHHWVNPNPHSEENSFRMHASSSSRNSNRRPPNAPPTTAVAKGILSDFLDAMPKLPSHYCRSTTNKLYIEPIYGNNISDVYKEYIKICREKRADIRPVCRFTFDSMVSQRNISFQAPKKDRCDTCISYEVGTIDKATHEIHINRKIKARECKAADKKDGESSKCMVITQDVQAVKVCPSLNASALYYKTKLCCHNFTIHNNITHQARCYWFTETDADLTANTFASCIVDYLLETIVDNTKPVIIWSDGCNYQNKNATLSNALLSLSVAKNITIYQKYLEKGHTQMEADSVHATIERRLGKKHIYLPSDYHKITLEARTGSQHGPYEVKAISFDFIKDYARKATLKFESIRPGKKVNDPTVNDIKMIKYTPDGNIQVKLCFDEDVPFEDLPQRKNRRAVADLNSFRQLHAAPLKIRKRKYDDLQDLKKVLPRDCHAFYDGLPHD